MAHGAGAGVAPPPTTAATGAPRRSFVRALTDNWGSVVAVLIGLVTLTGAFLTWKSVNLNGDATDGDRQAVVQTIGVEKNRTYGETQLAIEDLVFARIKTNVAAAEHLDKLAKIARDKGLDDSALTRDATLHRSTASALLFAGVIDSRYVKPSNIDEKTTSASLTFDETKRRADLEAADPYSGNETGDPAATARLADGNHDRSLRLISFVVALAVVIVLLTLSQLIQGWPRAVLALGGTAGWLIITVLALAGDHA